MEAKKIKVATMTFHIAHNYGAMLQAYALETAINNLGFDCEVLDYRFPFIDKWSGIRNYKELKQEFGFFTGSLKYVYRKLRGYYSRIKPARKKFDYFMRNDMRLSERVYLNKEELLTAKYDVVVFGSDQIWNPELTNGLSPEYYGKYTVNAKKIAYAASCGTDSFHPEWVEYFRPLLNDFCAIGVRESGLANYIRKVYGLKAVTVLDPVFLLEEKEWDAVAEKAEIKIDEPYLLVYAFQTGKDIYNLARRIAKEKKLKLVSINYNIIDNQEDFVQLMDCGPRDFVSLIKNAQFVCTTSFHGMAFSIIFKKDFYCIGHPKFSHRNRDLLESIALSDRMIESYDDSITIEKCDYSKAEEKFYGLKDFSLKFLTDNITKQSFGGKNEQHS